jgi:endonuclease G
MRTLLLLLLLCASASAQVIHHVLYTTSFDAVGTHTPVWVAWDLSPEMLARNIGRTNTFTADPEVPGTNYNRDYARSGYDKGHLCNAQDSGANAQTERESFYFTNMVPQEPGLNRSAKEWLGLEMACRREVKTKHVQLHIIAGPFGRLKTIGPDKITVPAYCWKAVREGGSWTCYWMPNTAAVAAKPFTAYTISLSALDQKLGFKVETAR